MFCLSQKVVAKFSPGHQVKGLGVSPKAQDFEDVYLARVYSTALGLFRVPALGESVDRKLAIIRDTYAALYEEASSRRTELLEISVVLLIMLEIVLMVFRR